MSNKEVDARGLSCPQPVVLTQKAIKDGSTDFTVLVNTVVSRENVMRCAGKNRMQTEVGTDGDDFIIRVFK